METDNHIEMQEQIMQYLRGKLQGAALDAFEVQLQQDPELAAAVESMRRANELIRYHAISETVHEIRLQMLRSGTEEADEASTPVLPLFSPLISHVLKVAVVLTGIILAVVGYQYKELSADKIYAVNAVPYQLNVPRGGEEKTSLVEQLYRSGNYKSCVDAYEASPSLSIKETFLAGNAYLSLGQPQRAIECFQKVISLDLEQNTALFKEDAEYYLAIAYIGDNQIDIAREILTRIHQNPDHLYHDKVNNWLLWKLKWLLWKES